VPLKEVVSRPDVVLKSAVLAQWKTRLAEFCIGAF
jgi:hypothetical protein